MSHVHQVSLCLALTSLTACYSHRPATAVLSSNQPVRVRYAVPQDVDMVEGADSIKVAAVRELIGEVQRASGDSLWLLFSTVRDTSSVTRTLKQAIVLVVRSPGTTVELRSVDRVRTAVAVIVGTAIAVPIAFLILLLIVLGP